MKKNKYEKYAPFLGTLCGKKRFAIAHLLFEEGRPLNVGQICQKLGFEQSTVSHHLKRLALCNYVFSKPNGKERLYSLNRETIAPILEIVDRHVNDFCTKCRRVAR